MHFSTLSSLIGNLEIHANNNKKHVHLIKLEC